MSSKKNYSDTYITKFGWMVEITDNHYESDLLAIIYGFSQDGQSEFTGSIKYLMKWLQCSRATVMRHLDALVEKGILIKSSQSINNVTFNRYKVDLVSIQNLRTPGIREIQGRYQRDTGGGIREIPNNTNIDNTKDRENARTQKTPESVEETTHTLIQQATSQIKPLKQLLQDVIHNIGEDNGLTAMAEAIKFDYGLESRQVMQLIYEVLLERQQKGEVLKLIVPSTENEQIVFYMQLFARVRRFADYAQSKKQAVKMYGRNTQSKHEPEKM